MTRIGQQWQGGICDSCVFIIRVNMLTSYLIMHYHIVYFLLSTVCGNDEFLVCEKIRYEMHDCAVVVIFMYVDTVKPHYNSHLWDSNHWLLYRGDLLTG